MRGTDRSPEAALDVKRYEHISRKHRPKGRNKPALAVLGALLHRQESPKPLLLKVAVGNMRAIWFELRQEPAFAVVMGHRIPRLLFRTDTAQNRADAS